MMTDTPRTDAIWGGLLYSMPHLEKAVEETRLIELKNAELLERLQERTQSHIHASKRDVQTIQQQAVEIDRLSGVDAAMRPMTPMKTNDTRERLSPAAGSDVDLSRVWQHMASTHNLHLTSTEEYDIKSAVLDDYDAERIKQGNRIMRLEADAAGDRARCDAAEKETDVLREALIGLVLVTQRLGELEIPGAEDSAEVDHILSIGDCRRIGEAVAKAKTTLEDLVQ